MLNIGHFARILKQNRQFWQHWRSRYFTFYPLFFSWREQAAGFVFVT